jgi:hypothetical protein
VDHDQIPAGVLNRQDLKRNSGLIITQHQQSIWFQRIIRWRLHEDESAVLDCEADPVIADSMLAGGLENPNGQRSTP